MNRDLICHKVPVVLSCLTTVLLLIRKLLEVRSVPLANLSKQTLLVLCTTWMTTTHQLTSLPQCLHLTKHQQLGITYVKSKSTQSISWTRIKLIALTLIQLTSLSSQWNQRREELWRNWSWKKIMICFWNSCLIERILS